MVRAAQAAIDLAALRLNLTRVKQAAPGARVMAVVKADAYGHGIVPVARALGEADALGVACLEEAMTLRGGGIRTPIVLLEGALDAEELAAAAEAHLTLVVHMREQVEMLVRTRLSRPLEIWVKVDTGMHRLGLEPRDVPETWRRLQGCPQVSRLTGLLSHLACADDLANPLTAEQVSLFAKVARRIGGERSLANSAAILAWPSTHAHWVRPGIMLYGVSPFPARNGADEALRPVMTLSARLLAVRQCRQGQGVGYGASWRCPEDMPVGIVSIGYGDGYPRHALPGTPILVNGKRVHLIGRVSMDMLHVDLRPTPEARVGDPVVLWGEGLPVEEVARRSGTIAYELLCQVTQRVRRRLLQEPEPVAGEPPDLERRQVGESSPHRACSLYERGGRMGSRRLSGLTRSICTSPMNLS